MKIAIVSTRGIPNNYGGLEEFAEHVSVGLVIRGHEVIVYNPHFHPFTSTDFKGVKVKKKFSPEKQLGTAANFIYDYLSLRDAIKSNCDAILVCGYTTASVSYLICSFKNSKVITNIDGLEWKRAKWSPIVRKLAKWFERIAVDKSSALISDNVAIEKYVFDNYKKVSFFIPYAANIQETPDESVLKAHGLEKFKYHILIGRLEPENNIEMILDGVRLSKTDDVTVVFASTQTKYARYLIDRYKNCKKIIFRGWTSGQSILFSLRHFARIYFHGHSVGGTNPSLLEAMAGGALIAAHENTFNRHVLEEDALYFSSAEEVKKIIDHYEDLNPSREIYRQNNLQRIRTLYNWENIIDLYEKMFISVTGKK